MTLAQLDEVEHNRVVELTTLDRSSFSALCESLNTKFSNAIDGRPYFVSNTGDPYIEFHVAALCRPCESDIVITKQHVVRTISFQLEKYFSETSGILYWRIRPEEELRDQPQVIGYGESGRSWVDKEWKGYAIYMRLLRSAKPELQ